MDLARWGGGDRSVARREVKNGWWAVDGVVEYDPAMDVRGKHVRWLKPWERDRGRNVGREAMPRPQFPSYSDTYRDGETGKVISRSEAFMRMSGKKYTTAKK